MSRETKNYRELVERHVATIKKQQAQVEEAEKRSHEAEVKTAEALAEVERLTVDLEISKATARRELEGYKAETKLLSKELQDAHKRDADLCSKLAAQNRKVAEAVAVLAQAKKDGNRLQKKQAELDAANLRANQLETALAVEKRSKAVFKPRGNVAAEASAEATGELDGNARVQEMKMDVEKLLGEGKPA